MEERDTNGLPSLPTNKSDSLTPNGDKYSSTSNAMIIALSILIVLCNATVLALYIFNQNLRSKKNFLLASLALSDLFAGCVVLPLSLSCFQDRQWNVCLSSGILFRFLAISTILHILAITLEKYFTILHPFHFKGLVRKRHLRFVSGSIWVTSFVVALSSLTWLASKNTQKSMQKDFVYFAVTFLAFFLLPLGLIIFAQVRMFRAISKSFVLAKHLRRSQQTLRSETSTNESEFSMFTAASNKKALCAFSLMLGTFVISWFTWYLVTFLSLLDLPLLDLAPNLRNLIRTLVFLPSLVNPMLYTYYKHDFRKALYSYFKQRSDRPMTTKARRASTVTGATHGEFRDDKLSSRYPDEAENLGKDL